MIKIEQIGGVYGLAPAIIGMRNSWNSWGNSDTTFNEDGTSLSGLGVNDAILMNSLNNAGTSDSKYRRMIIVYADITAPLYWWKEFDTYKVGTVANSCSTMHKIQEKQFTVNDFSNDHLEEENEPYWKEELDSTIYALNLARSHFLSTKDKKYWWKMIQLLPSSYNQKRTVMLNYETLALIYKTRMNHRLDEWNEFIKWSINLEHSIIFTNNFEDFFKVELKKAEFKKKVMNNAIEQNNFKSDEIKDKVFDNVDQVNEIIEKLTKRLNEQC